MGITIPTVLGSRAPFLKFTGALAIKLIRLHPRIFFFAALPGRDIFDMIKFSFLASCVLMSTVLPALPRVSQLPEFLGNPVFSPQFFN